MAGALDEVLSNEALSDEVFFDGSAAGTSRSGVGARVGWKPSIGRTVSVAVPAGNVAGAKAAGGVPVVVGAPVVVPAAGCAAARGEFAGTTVGALIPGAAEFVAPPPEMAFALDVAGAVDQVATPAGAAVPELAEAMGMGAALAADENGNFSICGGAVVALLADGTATFVNGTAAFADGTPAFATVAFANGTAAGLGCAAVMTGRGCAPVFAGMANAPGAVFKFAGLRAGSE